MTAAAISQKAYAQPREAAFQNGERLTYNLGWALRGVMTANAGEVVFTTSLTNISGQQTYKVSANGRTLPAVRLLFDMNDTYETWLDMETLRPLRFRNELKENKYRFRSEFAYDWGAMKVHTTYQNLRRHPEPQTMTMDLTPQSADAVAFFFSLRSQDLDSFTVGEMHYFDLVLYNKITRLGFKVLGRETRRIGRLGTFNTIKLSCQLTSTDDEEGQTFEDGTEFFMWLSDDRNRIPLLLESPTKIGSIVATISRFEGLKYPLDSRVR